MLEYSQYRGLIEDIDRLDSRYPEVVSFSANPNLSYMFAYQGEMTPQEVSAVTVVGYTGTNLILNNLPSIGSSGVLFAKGDFIQIGSQDPNDSNFYPYPVTAQYDVLRGGGSTVTVPVHRPNFTNLSLAGQHISVGNAVQFKVFVKKMPLYKMNPGGSTALVSWSGPFPLYEWTGDV